MLNKEERRAKEEQKRQKERTGKLFKKGLKYYIRFAHENGCEWDADTCTQAALGANIDCLRYTIVLLLFPCFPFFSSDSFSLISNKVSTNRYAHENGCEWNTQTCSHAALGGDLECLMYDFPSPRLSLIIFFPPLSIITSTLLLTSLPLFAVIILYN